MRVMILGKDYIFIAVPKTASATIEEALLSSPHIEYHNPYKNRFLSKPRIAKFTNSHVPYWLAAEELDLSDKLRVGFVRNPFDRFISFCAFTKINFTVRRAGVETICTFANNSRLFMNIMLDKHEPVSVRTTMIWPMHKFLCDRGTSDLRMDFVGRYETLQESYDELCEKLNFSKTKLQHLNKSTRLDYRAYYTPSLVDRVAELYKTDLELFGYKFE